MIDLIKGIDLEISGELGRYNTLPIDALVKIAQSLQNLVKTLAETELSKTEAINLDNFKIELSSFRPGSAVPGFRFTQRTQTVIGADVDAQRKKINRSVDGLLKISSTGKYNSLKTKYKNPNTREVVVSELYNFVSSFGRSPVQILGHENGRPKTIYKLKVFKSEIKNAIIAKPKTTHRVIDEGYRVARVKTISKDGKMSNRIQKVYSDDKKNKLAYSPHEIIHGDRIYVLSSPLLSTMELEDDFFIIKNESLDIIGTGQTEEEAELNFAEEFDFIYKRYNELPDEQLTARIRRIKALLNLFVKNVE